MRLLKLNPVAKAVGVMSAVAVLVGGVTFAALSSSVTLTNNTVSGADANLQIWDGGDWNTTAPGFNVDDLIPGDQWSSENFFYFNNAGDTDLKVVAQSSNPGDVDPGFSEWADLKVRFTSYAPGCVDPDVETDMAALIAGNVELPCNNLDKDAVGNSGVEATEGNYSVSYMIAPEEVSGADVNVSAFVYTFTGTVAATPAP